MAEPTTKTKSAQSSQTVSEPIPVVPSIEPERELFSWTAPARPFKRRGKEFWTTIIAIAALFSFILYLAEGVMPVILIISVIFLFYVLSNVEPEQVRYAITNRGIKIEDRTTDMRLLTRYWFTQRSGSDLLVFESLTIPGRLEVMINTKDKDRVRKTLSNYLDEEEIPPTNVDKFTNWVSQKLPEN